jgi:hypothetical protein
MGSATNSTNCIPGDGTADFAFKFPTLTGGGEKDWGFFTLC